MPIKRKLDQQLSISKFEKDSSERKWVDISLFSSTAIVSENRQMVKDVSRVTSK